MDVLVAKFFMMDYINSRAIHGVDQCLPFPSPALAPDNRMGLKPRRKKTFYLSHGMNAMAIDKLNSIKHFVLAVHC